MTVLLADLLAALERSYPARLAEPWDTGIGLTCGDPSAPVNNVLLAVDVDDATVDEAIAGGCELLLTHHPLLFRPVQSVAADTPKGALVHRLIRAGTAHVAVHTNADRARHGVNDALADTLGLTGLRPLVPVDEPLDPEVTVVPMADSPAVHRPGPDPGLGRVGELPSPLSLRDFTAVVAARLPATAAGVRAGGDPDRLLRTIAVCGGAGDGELDAAAAAGADAYVTSDLRHHVAAEHLADPAAPALVEVAHWAGEWPWLQRAATVIATALPGSVAIRISQRCTDPWTLHAASPTDLT